MAAKEASQLQLTIEFKRGESGCVVATCPQFAGCVGQGRDRAEALESIADGIAGILRLWAKQAVLTSLPDGRQAVVIDLDPDQT
ncbi:MAG: hypothetical protein OXP37_05185 [Chloroflexota bacterium]|nr:hypothetical protein [Chloroflexota bacterium]